MEQGEGRKDTLHRDKQIDKSRLGMGVSGRACAHLTCGALGSIPGAGVGGVGGEQTKTTSSHKQNFQIYKPKQTSCLENKNKKQNLGIKEKSLKKKEENFFFR